ncbi:hypothetical protein DPMN_011942 [Dreissena polymorpha]|uniref:Uncharacterized protein n=1 Tax=Dreissena polymorpha TaxID=45954 RepID=A0A9D4N523_DREPO|nr:hypothetical protein DPMN_011942 [Dreissena polymorpha]
MAKIRERHPQRLPDSDDSGEEGDNSQDDGEELPQTKSPALSTRLPALNKLHLQPVSGRRRQEVKNMPPCYNAVKKEYIRPVSCRRGLLTKCLHHQTPGWLSVVSGLSGLVLRSMILMTNKARSKYIQQAAVKPPSLQPYMQSADQEHTDFYTARLLQTFNYSSNPGGYLPIWQQIHQHPPSQTIPAPSYSGRPVSPHRCHRHPQQLHQHQPQCMHPSHRRLQRSVLVVRRIL